MPDDDDLPKDLSHITPAYRKALWIVVLLNVGFGIVEMIGGFLADSQALKADALDFLGDGSITLLGLIAIGWSLKLRASSGSHTRNISWNNGHFHSCLYDIPYTGTSNSRVGINGNSWNWGTFDKCYGSYCIYFHIEKGMQMYVPYGSLAAMTHSEISWW